MICVKCGKDIIIGYRSDYKCQNCSLNYTYYYQSERRFIFPLTTKEKMGYNSVCNGGEYHLTSVEMKRLTKIDAGIEEEKTDVTSEEYHLSGNDIPHRFDITISESFFSEGETTNKIINETNNVSYLEEEIHSLEKKMESLEYEYKKTLETKKEQISKCELELTKSEETYKKISAKRGIYLTGGIAGSFFVILSIIDGIADVVKSGIDFIDIMAWIVIIVLAYIPISLFARVEDLAIYRKDIANKQEDIYTAQNEIYMLEQEYLKSLQGYQAKIDELSELISKYKYVIAS